MLKIRLQRVGRKHEPSFRLVLTDSKNATRSGRFKEILGAYDPRHGGAGSRKSKDSLNIERIRYWLSQGVNPTDTIHNLLVKRGVIRAKKIDVSAISKKAPATKEDVIIKETPMLKEVGVPTESVGKESV